MTEETATGPTDRGVGPDKGAREKGSLPRGKWANNKEFLLSMTGVIVGFGSLCHFPFLCFKNGGAVFLIPYFVILMFFGLPLFFLETALGQYTSEGGVTAWRKISAGVQQRLTLDKSGLVHLQSGVFLHYLV